jgi:hypothetical protein
LKNNQQKNARVIKRRALVPPDFGAFDPNVSAALLEAASLISDLSPLYPARVLDMPAAWRATFTHTLSEHFSQFNAPRTKAVSSPDEAGALQRWQLDDADLQSSETFITALAKLNGHLVGCHPTLRTGTIGTEPDLNGSSIEFPSLVDTAHQIDWLRCRIREERDKVPLLLSAICSLPIITNSHLFTDGNGRLSRAVFNHILHRIGMSSDVYLPVYEFMDASKGGFLIRLRQAEIQNEWEPFVLFMANFVRFCSSNNIK